MEHVIFELYIELVFVHMFYDEGTFSYFRF